MKSLDTNLLFTACFPAAKGHDKARSFVEGWTSDSTVVVYEGVLVELYNLLRNPVVMRDRPLTPSKSVKVVQAFRHHPTWRLVETAPVMEEVWSLAEGRGFPRRRIFDARIALTLQHHGVKEFATVNLKDFRSLGFEKVWNPLK